MGTKTEQLIQALDEAIKILIEYNETHWKQWLLDAKHRLLNSDYSGIEKMYSAFGGMGSFNDFVLREEKNDKSANTQLRQLQKMIYELVVDIRKNHEILDT